MLKWGLFHRVVTPKSLQGHIKVTARSNLLKADFSTIMLTLACLDGYDGLKHTWIPTRIYTKPLKRLQDNNKRAGGYTTQTHSDMGWGWAS